MKIESLEIVNFKSIAHISLKHLDALSIFPGNNGTGKVAIFNSMRLFNVFLSQNSKTPVIEFKSILSGKKDLDLKLTNMSNIEQTDSGACVVKEDMSETRKVERKYENFKINPYCARKRYFGELQNANINYEQIKGILECKLALNAWKQPFFDTYNEVIDSGLIHYKKRFFKKTIISDLLN